MRLLSLKSSKVGIPTSAKPSNTPECWEFSSTWLRPMLEGEPYILCGLKSRRAIWLASFRLSTGGTPPFPPRPLSPFPFPNSYHKSLSEANHQFTLKNLQCYATNNRDRWAYPDANRAHPSSLVQDQQMTQPLLLRCIMKEHRNSYFLKVVPEATKQGTATALIQDLLLISQPWSFNVSSISVDLQPAMHFWHGTDDLQANPLFDIYQSMDHVCPCFVVCP